MSIFFKFGKLYFEAFRFGKLKISLHLWLEFHYGMFTLWSSRLGGFELAYQVPAVYVGPGVFRSGYKIFAPGEPKPSEHPAIVEQVQTESYA